MNNKLKYAAMFVSGMTVSALILQPASEKEPIISVQEVISNLNNLYPKIEEDIYNVISLDNNTKLVLLSSGGKMITNKDGTIAIHDMARTGMSAYSLFESKQIDLVNHVRIPLNKEIVETELLDPIVYKSNNEKMVLNVFIEPFCGYCQSMHANIQNYLDSGFTINYYPLPLYGERSERIFQSIWSIENKEERKAELDRVLKEISLRKQGATYSLSELSLMEPTESAVISMSLNSRAGRKMGLTSTPALVSDQGQVVPGAVPPAELKKIFTLN